MTDEYMKHITIAQLRGTPEYEQFLKATSKKCYKKAGMFKEVWNFYIKNHPELLEE